MHTDHGEQRLQLQAVSGSCAALGSATQDAADQQQRMQLQATVPGGMWHVVCAALREAIVAARQ